MSEMDLNLLRVFDTLYELGNVTKTGTRLGLTQSAVSHALSRLRQSIGDPLFVRAPGGLQPTARAIEIAPGVREGLAQLRSALSPSTFEPEGAQRRFTIAAGSYFCAVLMPRLVAHARRIAPGVRFAVVPLTGDLLAQFDEGAVDLAMGAFTRVPKRLRIAPLYREELVWVAAADNPIAGAPVSGALLAEQPRIAVSGGQPFGPLRTQPNDDVLERHAIAETEAFAIGDAGDAPAQVYDAMTALAVVGGTDCIALVPRRFALQDGERHHVVVLDTPDTGLGIDLAILWHTKFDEDAGVRWLGRLVRELAG